MNKSIRLLVFTLDSQRYALRFDAVERVVRAVAVTPLPDAPEIVLGIINVQGRIVPVINMRRCFHHQEKEICTSSPSLPPRHVDSQLKTPDSMLHFLKCT